MNIDGKSVDLVDGGNSDLVFVDENGRFEYLLYNRKIVYN